MNTSQVKAIYPGCEHDGCEKRATIAYHYRELVADLNEWGRYCDDHQAEHISNYIIESHVLRINPDWRAELRARQSEAAHVESAPPEEAVDVAAARIRAILKTRNLNMSRDALATIAAYLEDSRSWIGD